ncbi:RES family NAD+ phosphorylase [Spirosoma montaniterrae]|uniref:RES family NAD+ phosphorylase n=1 Tax=Spirosoma montaniterrae TaxID=1178516 RepID=UPI0012F82252|nr:hypothetical protein [Spirosoma montaniterrae]
MVWCIPYWAVSNTAFTPEFLHDNHRFLADWLNQPDRLALGVPSAVVPDSYNILLHPLHPAYRRVEVIRTSVFPVDARLWIS